MCLCCTDGRAAHSAETRNLLRKRGAPRHRPGAKIKSRAWRSAAATLGCQRSTMNTARSPSSGEPGGAKRRVVGPGDGHGDATQARFTWGTSPAHREGGGLENTLWVSVAQCCLQLQTCLHGRLCAGRNHQKSGSVLQPNIGAHLPPLAHSCWVPSNLQRREGRREERKGTASTEPPGLRSCPSTISAPNNWIPQRHCLEHLCFQLATKERSTHTPTLPIASLAPAPQQRGVAQTTQGNQRSRAAAWQNTDQATVVVAMAAAQTGMQGSLCQPCK